jgi:hypothetical protein
MATGERTMIDPSQPLSVTERQVFGTDARRHPVLGFVLECGSGCLDPAGQAENYCRIVERDEGPEAANALRAKLRAALNPLQVVKEQAPGVRPLLS